MGATIPDYTGTNFRFDNSPFNSRGTTPKDIGYIISTALPYVYVFAGLALLLMLIWGGVTLMTAAGNPDKAKSGYGKVTGAFIGFLIVFVSYFVVQLVEVVFNINIFN